MVDRLLYGRRESAGLLSISLRQTDQLIAEQKLKVRRVGRRVLVTADSLREYALGSSQDAEQEPGASCLQDTNPVYTVQPSNLAEQTHEKE
jgi:hypothetical protein